MIIQIVVIIEWSVLNWKRQENVISYKEKI